MTTKLKRIDDHAEYAEILQLLSELDAESTRLDEELAGIREQLWFGIEAPQEAPLGVADAARRLLEGADHHVKPDVAADLRERELHARERQLAISKAAAKLRFRIETVRERARREELATDPRTAEIRQQFAKAVAQLAAVIRAEDRLIADVVSRGFGTSAPVLTTSYWLTDAHRETLAADSAA